VHNLNIVKMCIHRTLCLNSSRYFGFDWFVIRWLIYVCYIIVVLTVTAKIIMANVRILLFTCAKIEYVKTHFSKNSTYVHIFEHCIFLTHLFINWFMKIFVCHTIAEKRIKQQSGKIVTIVLINAYKRFPVFKLIVLTFFYIFQCFFGLFSSFSGIKNK